MVGYQLLAFMLALIVVALCVLAAKKGITINKFLVLEEGVDMLSKPNNNRNNIGIIVLICLFFTLTVAVLVRGFTLEQTQTQTQTQSFEVIINEGAIGKVNINDAPIEILRELPYIGPKLSEEIVNNRPYDNIQQLKTIDGIGPKNFEKMKDLITVEDYYEFREGD